MNDADSSKKRTTPVIVDPGLGGNVSTEAPPPALGSNQLLLTAPSIVPPSPSKTDPKRPKTTSSSEKGNPKKSHPDKKSDVSMANPRVGLRRQ